MSKLKNNPVTDLTMKEYRITGLITEGLKNKDIGNVLGTSENYVKNQIKVIFDKLGMWNRVELALWYVTKDFEGKIPPAPVTEVSTEMQI